jgi:uncharacterized protein (DUF2141 family)
MQKVLFIIILIRVFGIGLDAQTLVIHLPEPTSSDGSFMLGIYHANDNFPEEPSIPKKIDVDKHNVPVEIKNLNEGKYAVSVYQDLNGNAKLDRNLVGIPKEPFAFSNMSSMGMGPPKFADAAFQLGIETKEITLEWLNE